MSTSRPTSELVPSSAVHRRLFIVGCPRAGAALVQRLLAAHPGVHAFPDSGLFLTAFGARGRRLPLAWLGFTPGGEKQALEHVIDVSCRDGGVEAPPLPPRTLRLRPSVLSSVATLDRLALAHGRRTWIERTPRHFLHARAIERLVPRARIIHVIRDGRDVVASVCDRARRHPRYYGRQRNPRHGIREWNRAIDAHARCLDRPGHVFVLYEDLVTDPQRELRRIALECGLDYQDAAAEGNAAGVTASSGLAVPVHSARSKFRGLFGAGERRRIERALHLDRYGALAERLKQRSSYIALATEPAREARAVARATDEAATGSSAA